MLSAFILFVSGMYDFFYNKEDWDKKQRKIALIVCMFVPIFDLICTFFVK